MILLRWSLASLWRFHQATRSAPKFPTELATRWPYNFSLSNFLPNAVKLFPPLFFFAKYVAKSDPSLWIRSPTKAVTRCQPQYLSRWLARWPHDISKLSFLHFFSCFVDVNGIWPCFPFFRFVCNPTAHPRWSPQHSFVPIYCLKSLKKYTSCTRNILCIKIYLF